MKVILVLIVTMTGHGTHREEYPMPSMQECLASVDHALLETSNGDENEQSAALFCAYED